MQLVDNRDISKDKHTHTVSIRMLVVRPHRIATIIFSDAVLPDILHNFPNILKFLTFPGFADNCSAWEQVRCVCEMISRVSTESTQRRRFIVLQQPKQPNSVTKPTEIIHSSILTHKCTHFFNLLLQNDNNYKFLLNCCCIRLSTDDKKYRWQIQSTPWAASRRQSFTGENKLFTEQHVQLQNRFV